MSLVLMSAADDIEYFILPAPDLPLNRLLRLQSSIEALAGSPSKVYASIRQGRQEPSFWTAQLSVSAFETLKAKVDVRASQTLP